MIKILITGSGSPGIAGTLYSLRNNYDNKSFYIIGTDIDNSAIGKFLCDKFYMISPVKNEKKYLIDIKYIIKREKIDIILPQNTMELELLSKYKNKFLNLGVKIIISNLDSIIFSNNKLELMKKFKKIDLPVGEFYSVNNKKKLLEKIEKIGYPKKKIVVKPPISNGQRGVRIIDNNYDRKKMFYNEKPNNLFLPLNELLSILGDTFNELIVTEFLEGDEYSVDVFRDKQRIDVIPRIRSKIRSGITFAGETIYNQKIIDFSKKISNELNLEYCFGLQFKLDKNGMPKILECNPRVQGSMVISTLSNANIIYSSVKSILGEDVPEFKIKWNTKFIRYWGGISIFNDEKISSI